MFETIGEGLWLAFNTIINLMVDVGSWCWATQEPEAGRMIVFSLLVLMAIMLISTAILSAAFIVASIWRLTDKTLDAINYLLFGESRKRNKYRIRGRLRKWGLLE